MSNGCPTCEASCLALDLYAHSCSEVRGCLQVLGAMPELNSVRWLRVTGARLFGPDTRAFTQSPYISNLSHLGLFLGREQYDRFFGREQDDRDK